MLFKNHMYKFLKNNLKIYYKEFCDTREFKSVDLLLKNNNNYIDFQNIMTFKFFEENIALK